MRRVILVLVCAIGFALAGAQTARADQGRHGHHGGYRPPVHRGPYNNGYRGGHGGHYGRYGNWCGPGPGYVYAAPIYPYAYPQAGFGLATRNFSFWFGQ